MPFSSCHFRFNRSKRRPSKRRREELASVDGSRAGWLAGHQTYGHSTGIQEQDSLQYWDVTWAASLRTNLEIAGLSSSHQEHSA